MTLETLQAMKSGGSKGGPGASAASWGGSARRWRMAVAKRASQRRVGWSSYHRQSFQSAMYKTGGGYWTCSDEFCEYPLLEKLHFHVALEEVRVTELLSY